MWIRIYFFADPDPAVFHHADLVPNQAAFLMQIRTQLLQFKDKKDCSKLSKNNGSHPNLLDILIKLQPLPTYQLLPISLHFLLIIFNCSFQDPDPGRKINADPDSTALLMKRSSL